MPQLNTYTVDHWIKSNIGFELIDVRPREPFRRGHLPQADNVPLGDPAFEEKVQTLMHKRENEIVGDKVVVYAGEPSDGKAHEAAERLEKTGMNAVYEFPDGIEGWRRDRHRLRTGDFQPTPPH